jgi:hypothetical protein
MTTAIEDLKAMEARVRAARDADALKEIVATIDLLPGSRHLFTARELIETIEAAVLVPALADRVTRTLGLRDKVKEFTRSCAATPHHAI